MEYGEEILCKRFEIEGLKGRSQYVIIDDEGVMITFPDNHPENRNYQATATALTRIISIAVQAGVEMDGIKRQLRESSMQERDTPDVLLTALDKYEQLMGIDSKIKNKEAPTDE